MELTIMESRVALYVLGSAMGYVHLVVDRKIMTMITSTWYAFVYPLLLLCYDTKYVVLSVDEDALLW